MNPQFFTDNLSDPYDSVQWTLRDTAIRDYKSGAVIFEQKGMEFPSSWSDSAVKITAQKYFAGAVGSPDRETSLKQMINRVVGFIAARGEEQGHLTPEQAPLFCKELTYLCVNQMLAFNSPVWFNVGVNNTNGQFCFSGNKARKVSDSEHKPQVSACFIQSIQDDMSDILDHYVREGRIFANGSGSGSNFSTLRGSMELLSGGGMASGPLSFMRGFDTSAGTIKSGGKTRRAAKMAILNIDHPDIEAFIKVKARQEGVARDLMSLGYDAGFDVAGGVYDIVSFQNTNHAVRVTDEFMSAVEHGDTWTTKAVKTGKPVKTYDARELLRMIAQATHDSGDPGMQFDTVTNRWNTVADTRRINASNPCSEYTFVDDSACNLASLNLMKFITPEGEFKIEAFRHAVAIAVLAQEILVDSGGYPTEMIAINSHMYRPLGLGYANLGALVMAKGYAYDSPEARTLAAEITALMTAQAYLTSAEIAARLGPFPKYKENRKSALRVLSDHGATAALKFGEFYTGIGGTAVRIFREALTLAEATGYRNAQVTLLAPCGTIGFMMDCATTGIEPELALVKYKTLVGGGTLTLINPLVGSALQSLGYSPADTEAIVNLLQNQGYAEGISLLKKEHLPVFDTSFPAGPSARAIHFMGHLKMMAAVQPFLSGAISKTVNMPKTATVDDIYNVFLEAWRMKLKCVAIYRDGSKGSQPLSTTLDAASDAKVPVSAQRKMVGDRKAVIHEFQLNGHKGFLTVGLYEDGTPGEVFVDISKEGSTVSGLMDSWSMLFSFCLQHGVPMEKLIKKLSHTKFDPSGWSAIPEIGYAHSLPDYIARWLELRFIRKAAASAPAPTADPASGSPIADGPMCPECGCQTVRSGTCHRCPNCGGTTGCS